MYMRIRCLAHLLAVLPCLGLGSCLFDEMDAGWIDHSAPPPTFSIGGTVTGVTGVAGVLTLQNSNGTLLNVTTDGSFEFEKPMVPSAPVVSPRTSSTPCHSGRALTIHWMNSGYTVMG